MIRSCSATVDHAHLMCASAAAPLQLRCSSAAATMQAARTTSADQMRGRCAPGAAHVHIRCRSIAARTHIHMQSPAFRRTLRTPSPHMYLMYTSGVSNHGRTLSTATTQAQLSSSLAAAQQATSEPPDTYCRHLISRPATVHHPIACRSVPAPLNINTRPDSVSTQQLACSAPAVDER